ncbi:Hypothetical predicted protein [Paramuricea clavata]|uniref:3-keto-alpha-glucoside-1,2-lyase/3-keto-2-hydroxy-glucal hydratase domain-containing protein n=1 Tax=Paramuricea clavata TaxID=317549 RepID=A0A6S7GND7_PARCT|nr:Hypothetical predicted protein [Paramuricea clavata]
MFVLFVIPFLLSSHCVLGDLHNYTEIHKAKNLVDSLSFKLYLNFQRYQGKYERLNSTKDEIKMLNRLQDLLNDLTKKNSICEKFYANFDLIAARQILINSNVLNVSLQKDYTVGLQGNKDAGKAKQNPENVYLFYDDFSDSNLEKRWQKNWGTIDVENGVLKMKIRRIPTRDNAEISVFIKHGHEWEDIEAELDLNERNMGFNVAPGTFLRVQDARIQRTTAWWFEYIPGYGHCTMRPFQNNRDSKWLYKTALTQPLCPGFWYHFKYRVAGDRFSHWVDNQLIHDNVKVSPQWMITKGTLGFGCLKSKRGCHTSYDNIKITKYIPVLPTVSLGGKLDNGVYWIKTSADHSVQTYCDLANGGWTLVGKVSGFVDKLNTFWLIKNYNVDALGSATLPSKVGCIDARYLATYHASTVMFSSGDNQNGIGSKWVQWPLPRGRENDSLWTHSVGLNTVSKAKMYRVIVKAWNGKKQVCYQNKYGIMPHPKHGGSYPSATYNTAGKTRVKDNCMAVGVQQTGTTADGWSQNDNGYDSPRSDSDWPNSQYNPHASPYVTVWLK